MHKIHLEVISDQNKCDLRFSQKIKKVKKNFTFFTFTSKVPSRCFTMIFFAKTISFDGKPHKTPTKQWRNLAFKFRGAKF